METLKYTVIKSKEQYSQYCNVLETLVTGENGNEEEIDLLTVLIEKWDAEHNTFKDANPVELLRLLMQEHNISSTKLAQLLGVSKGLISDILHYKKGFSKESVRALAGLFKVSQEAFNRPYTLAMSGTPNRNTAVTPVDKTEPVSGKAVVHRRAAQPGSLVAVNDRTNTKRGSTHHTGPERIKTGYSGAKRNK